MTPSTFRAHLAALGWSQRGLADMLRRDERQVRRWLAGTAPVPPDAAAWILRAAQELPRLMAAVNQWHANNPPPPKKIRQPPEISS